MFLVLVEAIIMRLSCASQGDTEWQKGLRFGVSSREKCEDSFLLTSDNVGICVTKKCARQNWRSCKAPSPHSYVWCLAQVAANFTPRAIAPLFFCPSEREISFCSTNVWLWKQFHCTKGIEQDNTSVLLILLEPDSLHSMRQTDNATSTQSRRLIVMRRSLIYFD